MILLYCLCLILNSTAWPNDLDFRTRRRVASSSESWRWSYDVFNWRIISSATYNCFWMSPIWSMLQDCRAFLVCLSLRSSATTGHRFPVSVDQAWDTTSLNPETNCQKDLKQKRMFVFTRPSFTGSKGQWSEYPEDCGSSRQIVMTNSKIISLKNAEIGEAIGCCA